MPKTYPIHGETFLHEFADGRLMEVRRDHAYSPDLFVEMRYVRPDGKPFPGCENVWVQVTGEYWGWLQNIAPELYEDVRNETAE